MSELKGFEGFRQCLLRGAREAVLKRNPRYVQALGETLRNGMDLEEMLKQLRPLLRGEELREWQPLLETAEQCMECARAARVAVRLFRTAPPGEYLQASDVTLGDWTHYHLGTWIVQLVALLERSEQLVKQACRTFLRPHDPSWRRTEDSLLTKIRAVLRTARAMRVRHAHGFGYFDAIEEQKLWEFHVVAFPDVDMVAWGLAQQVQFRDSWGKRIVEMTADAFAVIDAPFDELTTSLGWQPLLSQTRP